MVKFFQANKHKSRGQVLTKREVLVPTLDHRGHGLIPGQPSIVIPGALANETVTIGVPPGQKQVQADLVSIQHSSPLRRAIDCPYHAQIGLLNACGGCRHRHQHPTDLLAAKKARLTTLIQRQLLLDEVPWQADLRGPDAYRRKVRLAVDARNAQAIKVGFRPVKDKTVLDIAACPALTPKLQPILTALHQAKATWQWLSAVGHIELIEDAQQVWMYLHTVKDVAQSGLADLQSFAASQQVSIVLGGRQVMQLNVANGTELTLDDYPSLPIKLGLSHFMQVNAGINRQLIQQALAWLALEPTDKVIDAFCGAGNFTLPIAQQCQQVLGLEGIDEMVLQVQRNAQQHGLTNISAQVMDLNSTFKMPKSWLKYNKLLLDPSREGAHGLLSNLVHSQFTQLVYVSCNPQSWLRDSQVLLAEGWQLQKLSAVDMFPFTEHLELISLFTRPTRCT